MSMTSTNSTNRTDTLRINIVHQKQKNRWYLHQLTIPKECRSEQTLIQIRMFYNTIVSRIHIWQKRFFGIRRPVVYIGCLPTTISYEPIMSVPLEVTILSFNRCAELTAAFGRPHLLRNCGPFRLNYEEVLSASSSKKAIVIDYETEKRSVAVMLCLTLLVSVIAGVAFGVGLKRADLGIAISASLFTTVSILEMLAIWLCT